MLVFWFWREIVFGVTYVLSVQNSCAVVSVFWLWRGIVLKMRTGFYKKILLGYLLWSASRCVYFIRPNTLYSVSFYFVSFSHTAQIHKLKFKSLLRDKYVKSSKCKHWQSHYDFLYTVSKKISYWVSLFYRNNLLTKVYFSWDPNFQLLRISSCIVWIYSLTVTIVSQKYWQLSVQVEISEE